MKRYQNDLRDEIVSLPAMTRFLLDSMKEKCQEPFTPEELKKFKNIVLTGCGDSLCAAYAVRECFEKLTGLHIDTPACIDFSRHYDVRRLGEPGDTLVVCISYSGKVSRVVEAAQRARKYGAVTMAVSHYADSPVTQACDRQLDVTPEPFEMKRTPGCRNYVASMESLYLFAIHLGLVRGTVTPQEAQGYYRDITDYIDAYDKAMDTLEDAFYAIATDMRRLPYFEMLSSGPEFATAWFAQAKMYEATNDFSRYENFEDWAHVDYILRKMDSGMFLYVSAASPALSRAVEVAGVLTRQDYNYRVITDADPALFADPDKVVAVPASRHLWLNPLLEAIPACMFAGSLQDIKKTTEFCKDMIDSYFPFGGAILRNSKIEVI